MMMTGSAIASDGLQIAGLPKRDYQCKFSPKQKASKTFSTLLIGRQHQILQILTHDKLKVVQLHLHPPNGTWDWGF